MSESEPTLYGTPNDKTNRPTTISLPFPRLTDADLATMWARRAANEDRLDLASALYRIAAQAKRLERPAPDHEKNLRKIRADYEIQQQEGPEPPIPYALADGQTYVVQPEKTALDPIFEPTREEPRKPGTISCRQMATRSCPPDACVDLPCARFAVTEEEAAARWQEAAYEPRSHAPAVCHGCQRLIRWCGSSWDHVDSSIDWDHDALPDR